ncbi:hypothetical protein A2627_03515 [Candidatus Woesebacteria bacterium RIFCSPHIGHO2_01_FULL_39_28]|uniref:TVP38/TMEM64 family membrane protein n=1 Tax=Candidatus Woesebacteria bacterium RIFCSPHIGHO2_01_FULL_39_28 TaxID=1802496 RepID=A0A1F7YC69_9BACT|nr:MAG: hypothetical protein A2627_03515 [Candidatus Woesebacteria bacterium RIFCSPHIGHO2_01_FULL_39_28]OGM57417.1 MAG: hypothetical protein A3A50_05790 [Candidatus Woesebacteria bacterium RIFCSPLOWO2_01_FULL_38_20]
MKTKKILLAFLIIILFLSVIYLIHKYALYINPVKIKLLIRSWGPIGPLIFILISTTTIIFSPLTSFPLLIVSLSLYGYFATTIYTIIANAGGSALNFYLARRFGRPLIKKFVGKEIIKKIDEFTKIAGLDTLFMARLFGGVVNDYVSYAAGLTSMKFKPYIVISVLVNIPSVIINLYLLSKAVTFNFLYIALFGIWIYILAIAFPIFIFKYRKKHQYE